MVDLIFYEHKTEYESRLSVVGQEKGIRDRKGESGETKTGK